MDNEILNGDWELIDTYGSESEAEDVADEYKVNGRAKVIPTKNGYAVYISGYNAWEWQAGD